jgi:hypothetical protein
VRNIVLEAVVEGIIPRYPFDGYRVERPEPERKYLPKAELRKIINGSIGDPTLSLVRDMFLMALLHRPVDMRNLSAENIVAAADGNLWIRTFRQKTGVKCNVPLLEPARRIIEKYTGCARVGCLLPVPTNGALNTGLKIIARLCGVEDNITFHLARHMNFSFRLKTSKL